jgi:hypothetical protein
MLHEEFVPVIGAILAGIALILSIYVFKGVWIFKPIEN